MSVHYSPDAACLSESFMAHDQFAKPIALTLTYYKFLSLAICLTSNATPYLEYHISKTSDGSAPPSPGDLRQQGILVLLHQEKRTWLVRSRLDKIGLISHG